VIGAKLVRDLEIGAEEGGTQFRDQLLDGVGSIAEALAELPVKPVAGARVVTIMPISA